MGYAAEYAPAIMHRGRNGMPPNDFTPNWGDAPRKGKFYPGLDAIPLPHSGVPAELSLQSCLTRTVAEPERGFTLQLLSGMLLDSYAMLGRRLAVQSNSDLAALPGYPTANWFRATTSGGGLYPCSIYWVCGPSGPLAPGVYYYSTPRHALQPLLRGDVTDQVAAALGDLPGAGATDQYLVVGLKFWQNAFKYNSFSYHAVTMDLGVLLEAWGTWASGQGLRIRPALWFDEAKLADLLGTSVEQEAVFAVVPLTWAGAGAPAADRPMTGHQSRVRHSDRERSRRVLHFPILQQMREATVGYASDRPVADALQAAAPVPGAVTVADAPTYQLPAPQPLDMNLRTALRQRRSSFGRFEARTPMTGAQLAALLAASAGVRIDCDVTGPQTPALTKMYVVVNHVEGVAPGSYEYLAERNALRRIRAGISAEFRDHNYYYFLANYNVEQAAAVIVPAMRTGAVLDALGDRGYHLVNATIGAISQTCYVASAALGVGCGVALGFDNISYTEELSMQDTGEWPMLLMMVGNERAYPANYRYEIV